MIYKYVVLGIFFKIEHDFHMRVKIDVLKQKVKGN